MLFTLDAAPPWITDLTKIPRSLVPRSVDMVFPLTLTPSPADPVSDRGMSKRRISLFRPAVREPSVSPDLSCGCKTGRGSEMDSSRWNREGAQWVHNKNTHASQESKGVPNVWSRKPFFSLVNQVQSDISFLLKIIILLFQKEIQKQTTKDADHRFGRIYHLHCDGMPKQGELTLCHNSNRVIPMWWM